MSSSIIVSITIARARAKRTQSGQIQREWHSVRLFIRTCQALSSYALCAALSLCFKSGAWRFSTASGPFETRHSLCSFGSVENLPCNCAIVGAIEMPRRLIRRVLKTILAGTSARPNCASSPDRRHLYRGKTLFWCKQPSRRDPPVDPPAQCGTALSVFPFGRELPDETRPS